MRVSTIVILVTAAFLLGGIGGGLVSGWLVLTLDHAHSPTAQTVTEHAQINVASGLDPAQTPCVDDAKVATAVQRGDVLLEIIWSNKCYAGWGRITRYDAWQNETATVSIYPETAASGPLRQSATASNVQGLYTTLVVRPSEDTRLCAVGSYTVQGRSIDLGEPLCT